MIRAIVTTWLMMSLSAAQLAAQQGETYPWTDVGMGPTLLRLPVGSEWSRVEEETGALTVIRTIISDAGRIERAEYITVDWESQPEEFTGWLPGEFALAYLEWEVENIFVEGVGEGLFELVDLQIGQTERDGRAFHFLKNTKRADPRITGYSTEVQELWVTSLADARATGRIYKVFLGIVCMSAQCTPAQLDLTPLRQALGITERLTSADVEALLDAGAGEEALALVQRLRRSSPYSTGLRLLAARAEHRIGRDHALDGQHQQAIDAFDRALNWLEPLQETRPGDGDVSLWLARAHYRRAMAFRELWQIPEAIEAYRSAQSANPGHHRSFAGHAFTAFLIGDYAQAEDLFAKAFALKRDDGIALNNLAWMRVAAGLPAYRDPEQAADLVFDAIPEKIDSAYLDTGGAAMFRSGRAEKARESYIRAIRLDPVYAARLVNDLADAGCADPDDADPAGILPDIMLQSCLDAGYMPFYLSENLRRIDYLAEHDPENARRHLETLEAEFPGHPETIRRRAASEDWLQTPQD